MSFFDISNRFAGSLLPQTPTNSLDPNVRMANLNTQTQVAGSTNNSQAFIGPAPMQAAQGAVGFANAPTEQGHGTPTDPAEAKFLDDTARRNAVIEENTRIAAENKPIEAEISELETQERSLDALLNHKFPLTQPATIEEDFNAHYGSKAHPAE